MTETTRNPIRMIYNAAVSVKGNARACVFLEPLFAIPYTMYFGYMTLYMLELGMTKSQVGLVTSLGLAVHLFFALISAFITDKYGRKKTTLIFDIIGWGIAQLVWAIALDVRFFIAAAVINAFFRVVANSFHCLMLEDSEPESRIHIFNFLYIASIIAGFFTPLGAFLVNRLSLVPAMRIMIAFSAVSMMALFIIRHFYVTETETGRQKIEEMKGIGPLDVLRAYLPVVKRIIKDRLLMIALFLRSLNFIQLTIRNTFLALLVTERFGFPAETMAVFHTLNAVIMLAAMLFITPFLSRFTKRWPIGMGVGFHIAATVILLLSPPEQNYPLLFLSAALIALGTSIASPRIEVLVANAIENEERSVVNAIVAIILLLISTPFGYIGGVLSEIDARLPFLLTLSLFLICLLLLRVAAVTEKQRDKKAA